MRKYLIGYNFCFMGLEGENKYCEKELLLKRIWQFIYNESKTDRKNDDYNLMKQDHDCQYFKRVNNPVERHLFRL